MKRYLVLLLLIGPACIDQNWEAEVMAGLSGYNDDLRAKLFTPNSTRPAAGPNLKYNYNDKQNAPYPIEGDIRGNHKVNDWCFIPVSIINPACKGAIALP